MITTIQEYIAVQPEQYQARLQELYEFIKSLTPLAIEKISWAMPTFYLQGNLVHFALHKNHIGFYPGASVIIEFKNELKDFKHSKGAIQFPHNKDLPFDFIRKVLEFRINENLNNK